MIWILLIISSTFASQDIPLRNMSYGYAVEDTHGRNNLEFFLDLQCPDSKNSYDILNQVRRDVSFYNKNIKLTYQFAPLSWHFNSFKINQIFLYATKQCSETVLQNLMNYFFENIDNLGQQKWSNSKLSEFSSYLANKVSQITKIDKQQLLKQLESGSQSFNQMRYEWKYTVGSNAISGTPIFYWNNILIDQTQSYSYSGWIKFFQQYS